MEEGSKIRQTVYLLCNAHIDPVWQWEWEEGAAEALSTFRTAAQLCEGSDGFVFDHNEALLYRWVEEYDPPLFLQIRRLVQEGRWHIMGGWFLQPDDNMPSGESFVRQIEEGLTYFADRFGVRPTTAFCPDAFGHTRGLVQILRRCGYDSILFCRPGDSFCSLPDGVFDWIGYDGSRIMARRLGEGYSSFMGRAAEKIEGIARRSTDEIDACLWGVGDHGGGPSRIDLKNIAALRERLLDEGIELRHATPEAYFAAEAARGVPRPEHRGGLELWAPGCYTTQIRVKAAHRRLENGLYAAEKLCTAAAAAGAAYPAEQLREAQRDLLTAQFHDMLPGTTVEPAEAMTLRLLAHGEEIVSRVRLGALLALSDGLRAAAEGEIPIVAVNPQPYPVECDLACEMMLWDQNWDGDVSVPQVTGGDGVPLPTQCEKEASNIALDWRKRVVFRAVLPPMSAVRYTCRYTRAPQRSPLTLPVEGDRLIFRGKRICAAIDRRTGLLDELTADGMPYLKKGACSLRVQQDDDDPWAMDRTFVGGKSLGRFTLMSREEGTAFCGLSEPIDSVHVIEDGAVRTVVECVLRYRRSRAVVRYVLPKTGDEVEIRLRLEWLEGDRTVKLCLPTVGRMTACIGQTAFGEEELPTDGRENVGGYLIAISGKRAVGVVSDCTYGSSVRGGCLQLSLLRSPAYCMHPIPDKPHLPQDRYSPRIDRGEHDYTVRLAFGDAAALRRSMPRRTEAFWQPPTVLSLFPNGPADGPTVRESFLTLDGDPVAVSAIRRERDGDAVTVRLFNAQNAPASAVLNCPAMGIRVPLTFGVYEVKTLRLSEGTAHEADMVQL